MENFIKMKSRKLHKHDLKLIMQISRVYSIDEIL